MFKNHSSILRRKSFIALIAITAIAIIAIMEINVMAILNSKANSSEKVDNWVKYLNYLSLAAILITFVAGFLLVKFSSTATRIRDEKIASLSRDLIIANQRMANLSEELINSNQRIVKLNTSDSSLQENLRIANSEIENRKNENIHLYVQLEKEKQKTLEIKRNLAPRWMEQKRSVEKLKKLPKHKVVIKYIPDYEAYRFVGMLNWIFNEAGWDFNYTPAGLNDHVRDGLRFESFGGQISDFITNPKNESPFVDSIEIGGRKIKTWSGSKEDHIYNVSDALLEIFKDNNIDAQYGGIHTRPEYNTVFIEVGFKPNKFLELGLDTLKGSYFGGNMLY
jgi:hypothetical protein